MQSHIPLKKEDTRKSSENGKLPTRHRRSHKKATPSRDVESDFVDDEEEDREDSDGCSESFGSDRSQTRSEPMNGFVVSDGDDSAERKRVNKPQLHNRKRRSLPRRIRRNNDNTDGPHDDNYLQVEARGLAQSDGTCRDMQLRTRTHRPDYSIQPLPEPAYSPRKTEALPPTSLRNILPDYDAMGLGTSNTPTQLYRGFTDAVNNSREDSDSV